MMAVPNKSGEHRENTVGLWMLRWESVKVLNDWYITSELIMLGFLGKMLKLVTYNICASGMNVGIFVDQ